jgi:hypothetical protein
MFLKVIITKNLLSILQNGLLNTKIRLSKIFRINFIEIPNISPIFVFVKHPTT